MKDRNKDSLLHHPVRTLLVVVREEEVERRLGHPVAVRYVRLKADLVGLTGLGVAEEAQVDDRAGVNCRSDGSVRERVAVNLGSVIMFVGKYIYCALGRVFYALAYATGAPSTAES